MDEKMSITLDDLTPTQREIAEIIGLDNYIKLSKHFGGSKGIYIPQYSELCLKTMRPSRNEEIINKFNGYNYDELAAEYGLTVRTIYGIVSEMIKQKKNAPMNNQMAWF